MARLRRLLTRRGDRRNLAGSRKCSFCGKGERRVEKLIGGPGVCICSECVELCNEIIEEERTEELSQGRT